MKKYLFAIALLIGLSGILSAQQLPGFKPADFGEQQMLIENEVPETRILINAPTSGFSQHNKVLLVFFALPNGNSIEQTFGKKTQPGDDWHYNIQHIGAQTRFLRNTIKDRTIVVVYLEARQKSWPAWKAAHPDFASEAKKIVDSTCKFFEPWQPEIVLNGHSGGGRFIFSYLDAVKQIPNNVVRIAFLDSNYGYETAYGQKIGTWLHAGKNRFLCTLAYNDSVVIYNGKPLVSPTGGTWYRSKMMLNDLASTFHFKYSSQDTLLRYRAQHGQIEFILKTNPEAKIYHTVQVERNGFIHSMLSGTKYANKSYQYFGARAYLKWIADTIFTPIRRMHIPQNTEISESGSSFMKRIAELPINERENEIYKAFASGNMPDFLRNTITFSDSCRDAKGIIHPVIYEVMPDYLSVGNDRDFCRIPMNPHTAQKLAGLFGASLLSSKISDDIYRHAELKLAPFNYLPVGNQNELVARFSEHNAQIEKQIAEANGVHGQLIAGIKKDVIISEQIASKPNKVVIYGWHKPDGKPIQPVYSGHVDWYVDYSHGIRFINNQVRIDGKFYLLNDVLKDPILYRIFSDEEVPMTQTEYIQQK